MPDFGSVVSYYDSEGAGPIPAIVEGDNGDGTYDVVLFDINRVERRSAEACPLAADYATGEALSTNFILDDVGGGGATLWSFDGTYLEPVDPTHGMEVPGVIQAEPVGVTLGLFGTTPTTQPSAIANISGGAATMPPGADTVDFAHLQGLLTSYEAKMDEIIAAMRQLGSIDT